jgi:hypothetical protein
MQRSLMFQCTESQLHRNAPIPWKGKIEVGTNLDSMFVPGLIEIQEKSLV